MCPLNILSQGKNTHTHTHIVNILHQNFSQSEFISFLAGLAIHATFVLLFWFLQQEEATTLRDKVPNSVKDGPCCQSLKPILSELGVVQQKYHGGAFVGNHVHKALKKKNLKKSSKLQSTQFVRFVPVRSARYFL